MEKLQKLVSNDISDRVTRSGTRTYTQRTSNRVNFTKSPSMEENHNHGSRCRTLNGRLVSR